MDDLDLAGVCLATYSLQPIGFWNHLWPTDGSFAAHKRVGATDVIAWRGSETRLDWLDDLTALPTFHPQLGNVHSGFLGGVLASYAAILPVLGRSVRVVGHSLGAAHAMIFAGLLTAAGRPPEGVVCFGEPRPGFSELARLLALVSTRSYRNRMDPVTEVPKLWVPWMGDFFVHPKPLIPVDVAPDADDDGPFADHHMPLYFTAMEGLFPRP